MRLVGPDFQIVFQGIDDLPLPFVWEPEMPIMRKPGAHTLSVALLVDNPNEVPVSVPALHGTPSSAAIKSFKVINPVSIPAGATRFRVPVEIEVEGEHDEAATLSNIRIPEETGGDGS